MKMASITTVTRCGHSFHPITDIFDAEAEAAALGNLLIADVDEVTDDAGTTLLASSGTVLRSVADLFSL